MMRMKASDSFKTTGNFLFRFGKYVRDESFTQAQIDSMYPQAHIKNGKYLFRYKN